MSRLSVVQIKKVELPVELSNIITNEQLNLSHKKLARIRANLKALRSEVSDKVSVEIQDCRKCVENTMEVIGELNVALKSKIK